MTRENKYKPTNLISLKEIPQLWDFKRLKYLVTLNDEVLPENTDEEFELLYVEIADVNFIDGIKNKQLYQFKEAPSRARRIVRNGDVIISTVRTYLKAISIVENPEINLIVSTGFAVLRPRNILQKYLGYYALSSVFIDEIISSSTGVGYPAISSTEIGNIKVCVPPISEQKVISNYLDGKTQLINTLISQKAKLIEHLKEERIEIINHAVTKGQNAKAEMKPSGTDLTKEIPKSWTTKRIKYIASIFGRIGYRGYQTSDLVIEGEGAITLSPSNMKDLEMDYNKCTYLSWEKYNESPEIQIENGDIIFVKTGSTFGKVALVNNLPEKSTINPQLLVFKNIKISNDFFYFVLLSELIKGQVNTSVIGGTIPTISQEKIGNYYLFVPPVEEQKEIVLAVRKHLDRIKTAILKIEQEIELIKEYKAALINEVVTGKLILN